MTNQRSTTYWRNADFSNVQETYIGEPKAPRGFIGTPLGYIIMAIFTGPFFLVYVPMHFATQKYPQLLGFFKFIHYAIIVPLILFGLATVGDDKAQGAGSMFMALYFFLTMKVGVASLNKFERHKKTPPKPANFVMPPDWLVRSKVFGTPGDLSNAKGKFTDENISKGEEGERRTAAMMHDLLRIPGTRIFHGVHWPGTDNADIDHVVVNGDRIALIDSKMWSGRNHGFDREGNVNSIGGKDGERYERKIKLGFALNDLTNSLRRRGVGQHDIHGWVAIHTSRGTKANVNPARSRNRVLTLACAEDAIDEVGEWFASNANGRVRVKLMDELAKTLK
jgi:hypothetical protein